MRPIDTQPAAAARPIKFSLPAPMAWLLLLWWVEAAFSGAVSGFEVSHRLMLELHPETHRLVARDQMRATGDLPSRFVFLLDPSTRITRLEVNGSPRSAEDFKGRPAVDLRDEEAQSDVRIDLRYEARFADPAPRLPDNTDNPGFGVDATIQPEGTLLLGGSGWYPAVFTAEESYRILVSAPAGTFAVTSGRQLDTRTEGGRSISEWEIVRPVEALALAAGPYRIETLQHGRITLSTYFSEPTAGLSSAYLEASRRYVDLYEELFGPYPFEKFAVVENFFPTGYGFPSYTLIGGRVLRLPFILDTSLGHEIAHCWWGNGVLVQFESGNWSEGLTSYVAEHYYQELASPKAASDHRMNYLRNYATLVSKAEDFPLNRFRGRVDTVTRTVGYDKGAMVFHMLRRRIGEDAFWGGLQDVYRDHRFEAASWEHFRNAFEVRSGEDLSRFFDQWVHRSGAVELALEGAVRTSRNEKWFVSGAIRQQPPYYGLDVPIRVRTPEGLLDRMVPVNGALTRFSVEAIGKPVAIELDPDADLFRRLYPEEIPPSVNGFKGEENVLVVLGADSEALRPAAEMLVRAMPLPGARIVPEERVEDESMDDGHLIQIGQPSTPAIRKLIGDRIRMTEKDLAFEGSPAVKGADSVFYVVDHAKRPGRLVGVLLTTNPAGAVTVARKIPHYGRYSYLAFSGENNRSKGTWPVERSPLIHRWEPDE
ncbi:MAG: M1 family metallopeptidase [Desulfobacterales bacterium]